ncbi:MAG: methyl-accepting chemotaxis protein [Chloroflexota bacterium]
MTQTYTTYAIRVGGWMMVFISVVAAVVFALPYPNKDIVPWAVYPLLLLGVLVGGSQLITIKAVLHTFHEKPRLSGYFSLALLFWTGLLQLTTGGLFSPLSALYLITLLAVAQLLSSRAMAVMSIAAQLLFMAVVSLKGQLHMAHLPLLLAWLAILLLMSGYSSGLVAKLRSQVAKRYAAQNSIAQLVRSAQAVADQMGASSEELWASAAEMHDAAEQVASSAQHIAQGADLQAEQVAATSRAVGGLEASTRTIAHNATATAQALQHAADEVLRARALLDVLLSHTQEIDRMVALTERIHDQTELLALNAAIEAARAGEHGRGFAVVAHEVRKLSDNSHRTVQAIAQLSQQMQRSTTDLHQSMENVVASIHHSAILGDETKRATQQQEMDAQRIVVAINEMASIVEENAALTSGVSEAVEGQVASFEQVTASSRELAEMSEQLQSFTEQLFALPETTLAV